MKESVKDKMKTKKQLEKAVEIAKKVKFRNCLVCEKSYSLRQSSTKRYCSRKCSAIAERVRDWENKRGMNIRELQATLTQTNKIIEMIEKMPCICDVHLNKKTGKRVNAVECELKELKAWELLTKIKGDGK